MAGPCANSLLAIDASGHVLVRAESGSLYKYNGKTGALIWSCNDLEYVSTPDMQSSPAVDASGNIAVGSEYGSLYYIDGKTGAVPHGWSCAFLAENGCLWQSVFLWVAGQLPPQDQPVTGASI